jgi:IstB-like ATP binding protein
VTFSLSFPLPFSGAAPDIKYRQGATFSQAIYGLPVSKFSRSMRRYENRSTLMISNGPIEEWGKLLSDVPAAGAILDRLLHHAEASP